MEEIIEYSKLDLTNNFVFSKVMLNEELCTHLLELILDIKIKEIKYQKEEMAIDLSLDSRGVRLDVYVEDDNDSVYNIEMQARNPGNLPKRCRYYQGMIDLNLIEKGADYDELNESFVIFICTFDPFETGLPRYTFRKTCVEDKTVELKDGATTVFVNSKWYKKENAPEELINFLDYLNNKVAKDSFTKKLDDEIISVLSNEKWRREYMTLFIEKQEMYREGLKKGREEGVEAGRNEERIASIMKMQRLGLCKEQLLQVGYTEEEIETANSRKEN